MPTVDLGELFRKRRSIRKYKTDPVPREAIDRILEAGRWAPSGANRQPWLFVVVEDGAAKAEIRRHSEAADEKWHEKAPDWLKKFFDAQEISPEKTFLTDAPFLICVFGERGNPYWRESAWLAVGQMLLAAAAEGLGSLAYTPGQTSHLNRILQVDDRYRPLAVLPVGVPDEAPSSELRPRRPEDQTVRRSPEWRESAESSPESLHELHELRHPATNTCVPALGDSRLAFSSIIRIAHTLQKGTSAAGILPHLSKELTRLVPARSVEITMMGSALRCEVPTANVKDVRARRGPDGPEIDGSRATVPLSVGDQVFGWLHLERDIDYTPLELQTLVDASRVLSLGLWSRFLQLSK